MFDVTGACGHVSVYGLLGGCAHALVSMCMHAYLFSAVCNERWTLISFGDICGSACHCICGYTLTIPPPHSFPYYPRTKHPSYLLSQLKTIWLGLAPSIIMGARWQTLRLARSSAESACLHAHCCLHHKPSKPYTWPRTISFQWFLCPGMTL